ncbi:MAG: hypothetical protein NXI12_12080 [Alphaproteobacteria bacterium]|nr:hypothetical protein [Alphaproteobacteria bacterium]
MMKSLISGLVIGVLLAPIAEAQQRAMPQRQGEQPASQQLAPAEIREFGIATCRIAFIEANQSGITLRCDQGSHEGDGASIRGFFAPADRDDRGPSAEIAASLASSSKVLGRAMDIHYYTSNALDDVQGCTVAPCRRILRLMLS